MEGKQDLKDGYVKKETLFIVATVALVIGFLGGVLLTAYKSRSPIPSQAPAPAPPQQAKKDNTVATEKALMIFELEKKLSQNSSDGAAWTQLGNLYFDTNNHNKAIAAYNKSLELNPGNADVLTDLGVMYRRSGQPVEAVKAFDRAIKADPRHEISRFNKGLVLMHDLNDIEGAIKAWEELAELNPAAVSPSGISVAQLIQRFKKNESRRE